MKLSHILIAGTAFLSFGALAEGNKATRDRQAQSSTTATMEGQAHASASVIKQAQQKLSAAGHNAGPADGIMGARTTQALKDFQQAKGLEATGQLDQRTLAELGLDSAGVGATSRSGSQGSVGASTQSGSSETRGERKY